MKRTTFFGRIAAAIGAAAALPFASASSTIGTAGTTLGGFPTVVGGAVEGVDMIDTTGYVSGFAMTADGSLVAEKLTDTIAVEYADGAFQPIGTGTVTPNLLNMLERAGGNVVKVIQHRAGVPFEEFQIGQGLYGP